MMLLRSILAALVLLAGTGPAPVEPDTLVINTTVLGAEILGHHATTPVEISVSEGRIVSLTALPSDETPAYFRKARKVLAAFLGMTVEEALDAEVDAVSGATMSSNALVRNVREGLCSVLPMLSDSREQPAP